MEMQEKSQADFDLEKLFEMLDTALTSKDERVQNALRGLLTIIALTKTQDDGKNLIETSHGLLRQIQQDLNDLTRRFWSLQEEVRQMQTKQSMGAPLNPWQGQGVAGQPWTGTGYPTYGGQPFTPPYSTTVSTSGTDQQLWNDIK